MTAFERKIAGNDGQAMVEYALILALVAVLTIGVLQSLGHSVSGILDRVNTTLSAVPNP
ncbi:MAG: Flp family type IVb pilin [Actinobacteria bacterium]|nr:MAG: Flp family type IVb pilin [Actinomycetota bacterium]